MDDRGNYGSANLFQDMYGEKALEKLAHREILPVPPDQEQLVAAMTTEERKNWFRQQLQDDTADPMLETAFRKELEEAGIKERLATLKRYSPTK